VTIEFDSMAALATHLAGAVVADIELANRHSLAAAAQILKDDMRGQIGEYQGALGDYPAWEPLAESTEDEKARVGAPAEAPLERFGDLQKSFRSELVGNNEAIIGSTDPVMEFHEYGTSKMPPRPVVGPALLRNVDAIEKLIGGDAHAVICGQRLGYRFSKETGIGPIGGEPGDSGE
jgi:phage gpG-like protein